MKTFFLVLMAGVLAGSMAVAQQSPPAATGIGNQTSSPNSNVSNKPSMSPDQNQAASDTRGSTTGDKGSPDFAGSSGSQTSSAANAQGSVGATGGSSATGVRRHPRHHPRRGTRRQKGGANDSNAPSGKGTYQAPTPPTSGPSTTEAPGPATGSGPTNPQPPRNPDWRQGFKVSKLQGFRASTDAFEL